MEMEIKKDGLCVIETSVSCITLTLCDIRDIKAAASKDLVKGEQLWYIHVHRRADSLIEIIFKNEMDMIRCYRVLTGIRQMLSQENTIFYQWLQRDELFKPYCKEIITDVALERKGVLMSDSDLLAQEAGRISKEREKRDALMSAPLLVTDDEQRRKLIKADATIQRCPNCKQEMWFVKLPIDIEAMSSAICPNCDVPFLVNASTFLCTADEVFRSIDGQKDKEFIECININNFDDNKQKSVVIKLPDTEERRAQMIKDGAEVHQCPKCKKTMWWSRFGLFNEEASCSITCWNCGMQFIVNKSTFVSTVEDKIKEIDAQKKTY